MNTIVLEPALWETLERDAERESRTVDELITEAIEEYLQARHRAKLEMETEAYKAMHPDLKETYLGQWVAIHNGELVDHDEDKPSLYRRIRAKYERTAVLLREVQEQPDEDIWIRTPSTGKRLS